MIRKKVLNLDVSLPMRASITDQVMWQDTPSVFDVHAEIGE
jgi:hypothetical protein